MKTLLGCPGLDLNVEGRDGLSLLSLVVEAGCEDVFEDVVVANIDLNPVKEDRQIPLSRAAAG